MAVTIHVNGTSNSLVHKGSMGIAKSTIPDVCKTPAPPAGPIPIPYPNMAQTEMADSKSCAKKVKFDGMKAFTKKTKWKKSMGDEAGTAGGVVSSKNMADVGFAMGSMAVKVEGTPAVFMGCMTKHNGASPNAVGAAISPPQQKVHIMM